MVSITIIAAVARNRVIGHSGDMPWRLPSDLKRFRAATLGKPVVMGRKTLDSIGKPLAGRDNIIVSRQDDLPYEGVHVSGSFEQAVDHARRRANALHCDEIIIAGGGDIYNQSMEIADRLLITRVLAEPEGTTVFPEIGEAAWDLVEEFPIETGPGDSAELRQEIYQRRGEKVVT